MCSSFPLGIEGGMWDVIVLIPDHCLSIYFPYFSTSLSPATAVTSDKQTYQIHMISSSIWN